MEPSGETDSSVQQHKASSVARLAEKFNDQSTTAINKEVLFPKPIRKKPPCSLPLKVNKAESGHNGEEVVLPKPIRKKPPCSLPLQVNMADSGHNGEEKATGNTAHPPKIKVKSSPIIEKLQANLMFLPPGRPQKSPGLNVMPFPFTSPPPTPNSPNRQSCSSESDTAPVSFEQPPEEAPLRSLIKLRTKGSVKRRPPSRKFRKSKTDMGDEDVGAITAPEEDSGKSEEPDEVFESRGVKSEEPLDQPSVKGVQVISDHELPESNPGMAENVEEKGPEEVESSNEAPKEEMGNESTDQEAERDTVHDMDKLEPKESSETCQGPSSSTESLSEQETTENTLELETEEIKSNNEDISSQGTGDEAVEDDAA